LHSSSSGGWVREGFRREGKNGVAAGVTRRGRDKAARERGSEG